jgi:hypothetical protein
MYFELITAIDEDYGITKGPNLPDEIFFQAGELIARSIPEPLCFQCDCTAAHPPPDYLRRIIPIFSKRLLSVVCQSGVDNLQTFRAELLNPNTGEKWDGFYAVNIVGKISCADMGRSKYTQIGAGMIEFDDLVIKPEAARGELLFRLAESTRRIIIHEKVIEHIVNCDDPELTGFDINEVE